MYKIKPRLINSCPCLLFTISDFELFETWTELRTSEIFIFIDIHLLDWKINVTTPATTPVLTLNFQSFSSIISFSFLNCIFRFDWYSFIVAFCWTSNSGAFKVFSSIWSTGDALGNLCKIKSNLPSKIIISPVSSCGVYISYQSARLSFQRESVWHSYFGD